MIVAYSPIPPFVSRREGLKENQWMNGVSWSSHWWSNEFLTECTNECMNKQMSVINKWVIDSEWAVVPWTLFLLNNVLLLLLLLLSLSLSLWLWLLLLLLFHRCCAFTGEHIPMSVGQTMFQHLCICVHIYVYTCTHIIYVHTLYTYMCCLWSFLLLTPHIIIWSHINNIKHTSKIYSYIIITSIHVYIYVRETFLYYLTAEDSFWISFKLEL